PPSASGTLIRKSNFAAESHSPELSWPSIVAVPKAERTTPGACAHESEGIAKTQRPRPRILVTRTILFIVTSLDGRSEPCAGPGDAAETVPGEEKAGIHDARLAVRALEAEARVPRDGRARLRNEEPGAEDEPNPIARDGSHGYVILDGAREE